MRHALMGVLIVLIAATASVQAPGAHRDGDSR